MDFVGYRSLLILVEGLDSLEDLYKVYLINYLLILVLIGYTLYISSILLRLTSKTIIYPDILSLYHYCKISQIGRINTPIFSVWNIIKIRFDFSNVLTRKVIFTERCLRS
jgi:hypothetical protein